LAAVAQTATSFLLPAVLIPVSQKPPKISFVANREGIEIMVDAERLDWKRPSAAWTLRH